MNQPSAKPTRKVGSASLAGALAVILAFVLSRYAGVELSPDATGAVTALLMGAVAYLVPESDPTL